jgi:hypothetical protein
MNLDRLNRWLSLVANVGVLCGLVVLVLELNQNRATVRAQTRNEVAMGFIDLAGLAATNPELANVIRRGDSGEELTLDEQFQHRRFTLATYRYYENAHYQYRQGLYDEAEFTKQKEAWKSYAARSPGSVRVWCEVQGFFSPEFVADVGPSLGGEKCNGT